MDHMKAFVSTVSIRVAIDKHKKQQSQGHTSGNELLSRMEINELDCECQLLLVISKICSRIARIKKKKKKRKEKKKQAK